MKKTNLLRRIIEAIYALFFFKKHTYFERWFEITCGIAAWIWLFLVVYLIIF